MSRPEKSGARTVKAVHAVREATPDPQYEIELAADLRQRLSSEQLLEAFTQYACGSGYIDVLMRRICFRALVKKLGSGVTIGRNVSLIHPETFGIADCVFIGEQTVMQDNSTDASSSAPESGLVRRAISTLVTWSSKTTLDGARGQKCWDLSTQGSQPTFHSFKRTCKSLRSVSALALISG